MPAAMLLGCCCNRGVVTACKDAVQSQKMQGACCSPLQCGSTAAPLCPQQFCFWGTHDTGTCTLWVYGCTAMNRAPMVGVWTACAFPGCEDACPQRFAVPLQGGGVCCTAVQWRLLAEQGHVMCLQGRCAAVALYLNQLALLPVMETEGLELDLLVEDPYSEAAGSILLARSCTSWPNFLAAFLACCY